MPMKCVSGGMCMCSFGMAPSSLNFLPTDRVLACNMPMGNIMGFAPAVNVLPFSMCMSIANPAVAAATAAAFGVLTPVPCVPVIVSPWIPASANVLCGNFPALNMGDKCMCMWGGIINIIMSGQFTVL